MNNVAPHDHDSHSKIMYGICMHYLSYIAEDITLLAAKPLQKGLTEEALSFLLGRLFVPRDGEKFEVYAGVLATAISEFREKLAECDPGHYTLVTQDIIP